MTMNRDQQIDFIERADERDEKRIARWKEDSVIKKSLNQRSVKKGSTHVRETHSEKFVACA